MEANSTMLGPKQEEEIELELGLSIGGRFKRPEKLNPIKNGAAHLQHVKDSSSSPSDAYLRENCRTFSSNCLQLEVKHEIEAVRRQEAKKKRQEKQQKKITCTAEIKHGDCINVGYEVTDDNKMWLKSPELENKERDCKRSRVEEKGPVSNVGMKNVNLNFTVEQNITTNQNVAFNSTVCPVIYPYPALEYVQLPNGLQYPCVNALPCWATGGAVSGNDHGMVQPVASRSFRPFQSSLKAGNGCASDENSRKTGSTGNGSPMCSSSLASDYRTSSHEGGASGDTRSHSSRSLPEQCQLYGSQPNDTKVQSEHSASSHLRETAQISDGTENSPVNSSKPKIFPSDAQCSPSTNSMEQKIPSTNVQCSATKSWAEAETKPQPISPQNLISTTENLPPALLEESKREMRKPPKRQTQNQNATSLPHMPCVSTTGKGPNGKTIKGFLYRYTKAEVSIICVCHGTSFSPAEFVQHAGGTDISQPLKHITVIPSAF